MLTDNNIPIADIMYILFIQLQIDNKIRFLNIESKEEKKNVT